MPEIICYLFYLFCFQFSGYASQCAVNNERTNERHKKRNNERKTYLHKQVKKETNELLKKKRTNTLRTKEISK